MKKRVICCTSLFLAVVLLSGSALVHAHSPSTITLGYDFDTQELSVSVTHSVTDVNTHYIYEIMIEKNSVVVHIENYTEQESTSGVNEVFNIPSEAGDIIRVTAKCNLVGQLSRQITVSDETTTSANMFTPIMVASVLVAGIVLVLAVVTILRRR